MRSRVLAVLVAAHVLAVSLDAQERGLGAFYTRNLPGNGVSLPPGSLEVPRLLAKFIREGLLTTEFGGRPRSVVRLPTGHYVFSGRGGLVLELDANWNIVGTAATPFAQPLFETPGSLTWDRSLGTESRLWLGVEPEFTGSYGPHIRSYDWQSLRFDEHIPNSPFGLKSLEGVSIPPRETAFGFIAEIDDRPVWVTSDLAKLNFNFMGNSADMLAMSQQAVQLPPVLPDTFRCEPVYDPLDHTIWIGAMGTKFQPFRMVEHDLNGELTGRIYQPEVPFLPVNIQRIDPLGADFYIDEDGNRVLAFFIVHGDGVIFGGGPGMTLVEVDADFTYGAGCKGEISHLGDASIGSTWEVTLSDADPSSLNSAFLWRGTPQVDWLPIVPGVTSCNLHLDLSSRFGVLGVAPLLNGQASMNLPIPDESFLIGVPLGFQWLIPGDSSPLPLGLSSAGAVRIGDK